MPDAVSEASTSSPSSSSSLRQALAESAAAWVFVKHLHHTNSPVFSASDLAFWANQLLEQGLHAIQAGLSKTVVRLVGDSTEQTWQLRNTDSGEVLTVGADMLALCAEIAAGQQAAASELDKLSLVQDVTERIGAVFCNLAPWNNNFGALLETKAVHPLEIWADDWAVPYMCTWQAEGTRNELLCPPWHAWERPHMEYLKKKWGDTEAEIMLSQYLSCFLVPCHEVVHIAQTKHNLTDSDPISYSAEHDASRLNLPLLLLVLRSDPGTLLEQQMAWFTPVLMVQAVNRAIQAMRGISQLPKADALMNAYRLWAESFGLKSPTATFNAQFSDLPEAERQRSLVLVESYFKTIITAEALGAAGLRSQSQTSEEHLQALLQVAFHPDRSGDVYTEANVDLCQIGGTDLEVDEDAWGFVSGAR